MIHADYNPRERLPEPGELVLFKVGGGDCLWLGHFDGQAFISELSGVAYGPYLVKYWRKAIATDRGALSQRALGLRCGP